MKPLCIETQLSQGEFIRFSFYNFYRKRYNQIIAGIGLLGLLSPLLFFFIETGTENGSILFAPLILGLTFGILLPSAIYLGARSSFRSDERISEAITYTFSDAAIGIQGKSVEATLAWEDVYKVEETKRWYLIYKNPLDAFVLLRSDFDEAKTVQFQQMVRALPASRQALRRLT